MFWFLKLGSSSHWDSGTRLLICGLVAVHWLHLSHFYGGRGAASLICQTALLDLVSLGYHVLLAADARHRWGRGSRYCLGLSNLMECCHQHSMKWSIDPALTGDSGHLQYYFPLRTLSSQRQRVCVGTQHVVVVLCLPICVVLSGLLLLYQLIYSFWLF